MQKKKNRMTLEVVAWKWIQNAKLHVKESSYVKYTGLLKNHILPDLGNLYVDSITTEVVETFVRKKIRGGKVNHGGGLSEKTMKDILGVLKQINAFAACHGGQMECNFQMIRVRSTAPEIRVLKEQEQRQLEAILLSDNSLQKTGILLSLYMGLRLGEVCALTREHISYSHCLVHVRGTMQRIQNLDTDGKKKTKIIITEPKSVSSVRDIPIPKFLFGRLQCLKYASPDTFILTGSNEKFIEPRCMENILDRLLDESGIERVNYHTLRHTFATRCIERGFDAKTLSEILGHANVNITLNRYVHSSMALKRKNMENLIGY